MNGLSAIRKSSPVRWPAEHLSIFIPNLPVDVESEFANSVCCDARLRLGYAGSRYLLRAHTRKHVLLELFGMQRSVASLDVLIRSKRPAGRPKGLRSLPELEAIRDSQSATKDQKKR